MTSFQGKRITIGETKARWKKELFQELVSIRLEIKTPRTDVFEVPGFYHPLYTDSLFSLHEDTVKAPERKVF